jgi:hypothetical protein
VASLECAYSTKVIASLELQIWSFWLLSNKFCWFWRWKPIFQASLMGISGFGAVEQLNSLAWKVRSESRFTVIGSAESAKESCLF